MNYFTVSLEDHFLHPKIWEMFPDKLKKKYELVKDSLLELGGNRIKIMDAAEIDFQVLSLADPGLSLAGSGEEAVRLAREINNYLYAAIMKYPERLGAFAVLPMQSPPEAAKELERTVRELGFKGAMVNGHTNGVYLDDDSYSELLNTAESLDVPIYIHPVDPPDEIAKKYFLSNEVIITGWAWQVETANHLIRLISGGVFDRHPRLKIIVGHMGELIPYGFTRLNQSLTMGNWILGLDTPKMNLYYLFKHNIFITSSGVFDEPVFRCAKEMIGLDNLMFSVDSPFQDTVAAAGFLHKLSLGSGEKELFSGKTACKLLKLTPAKSSAAKVDKFERLKIRIKSKVGRLLLSKLVK